MEGSIDSIEYNINIKKTKRNLLLNLNLSIDQFEKIILSKFIIDENIRQNLSLIRLDNKIPNHKEKDLNVSKLENRHLTICLDDLFDALLPENMLEDLRIQNYTVLPEIPYIFLKFNKKNAGVVEFDNQKYFIRTPKTIEEKISMNNNLKYVNELNIPNIQSIKAKVYVPNTGYAYLFDHMEGETLDKVNLLNLKFNDKIMILYRILEVFQALEKQKEFHIELKIENVLIKKVGKQIDILFINYEIIKSEKPPEKSLNNINTQPIVEPKHYHSAIGNITYFLFHSKITPSSLIDNLSKNGEESKNKVKSKLQIIEKFIFNVMKYDNSISTNMEDLKLYLVANNSKMFNSKFVEKNLGIVNHETTATLQKPKKIDFKVDKFEPVPQEDSHQNELNFNSSIFTNDPSKLAFKKELVSDYQNKTYINNLFCTYHNLKNELTISYVMKHNKLIMIYDVKSCKQIKKINSLHNEDITCIRYFQDKIANNEYLITSSYDKSMKIFSSLNDYECVVSLKNCHHCYGIYSFVVLKNEKGTYITSSNSYGQEKLKVWDFTNGSFIRDLGDSDNNLFLDNWNYKQEDYLICCNEYSVKIYHFITGNLYRLFKGEPVDLHLYSIVFNIDGKPFLFESANNGYIRIWNILDNILDRKIYIKGCKFSNILKWNQNYLIVSSKKVFNIIDIEKKSLVKSIYAHDDWLSTLSKAILLPFGECLITSSMDGKIKIWA